MKKIVIGTSIAPYELEKQKECIATWISSGFEVISFNSQAEIEIIAPEFKTLDVRFCEIKRSAYELCGKELPFIQDILDAISKETECICGYCNSDIFFYNVTPKIYEYIYEQAQSSVLIVHRNEVNEYADIGIGKFNINFDGIDCFFADKSVIDNLYGLWAYVQMVWDTFLLVMCKRKNVLVKTLLNPIAFHKRHAVRWNSERTKKAFQSVNELYFDYNLQGFKDIFYLKYNYLLEYSSYIVYADLDSKKIMVVGDSSNIETGEYKLNNFTFVENDDEKEEYDLVIYLRDDIEYTLDFLKFVVALSDVYAFRNLQLGVFFWARIEGRNIFSQVNKNLITLKDINTELSTWTNVYSKNGEWDGNVLYPILKKELVLEDDSVVKRYMLPERVYIMPAGYRANEWLEVFAGKVAVHIEGIIDNDEKKIGQRMGDYYIKSLADATRSHENFGIIITTKYYQNEIRNQLSCMGNRCRVFDGDRILSVDEEGAVYYVESDIKK